MAASELSAWTPTQPGELHAAVAIATGESKLAWRIELRGQDLWGNTLHDAMAIAEYRFAREREHTTHHQAATRASNYLQWLGYRVNERGGVTIVNDDGSDVQG